jgi:hypothetical protein
MAGPFGLYVYRQQQVRHEMKTRLFAELPESDLVQIDLETFSDQIHWEEKGKEFMMGGEMYDVVKERSIGNRRIIFCINDKKEQELMKAYAKATNPSDPKKANGKHAFKFQQTDCFILTVPERAFPGIHGQFFSLRSTSPLSSLAHEVQGPPPRC